MDIGECHHRRGRSQVHGELVDEIPNGWDGSLPAQIEVGGKKLLANTQSFTEVLQLFRLGFQVLIPLVQENKIEHGNAALELAPESGRALAPMSARKAKELPRGEVTGMCCNEVEKSCLCLGVAKCLESVEMCGFDVHSERSQCLVFSEMRPDLPHGAR